MKNTWNSSTSLNFEINGLRCGYTTGSCAAAAAKASAVMLLTGRVLSEVSITTPQGTVLTLQLHDVRCGGDYASCAVKKDSGDDPDVTNGILIYASVAKADHGRLNIEGGTGIGRVTKPGLACMIGEPAINPVPRKMIVAEVAGVCEACSYNRGLDIVISAPEGERLAQRTFNPRLGITGGISILGTTGIVEPKSVRALIDTIYLEMRQQHALGNRDLLLCPGSYGQFFIRECLNINIDRSVKCSNFIGEALDFARDLGFASLLLIGHAGKLIKLGAGIMNTHSAYADARMEVIAAHAALAGAPASMVHRIMGCNTTEEAASVLQQAGLMEAVFAGIMARIDFYVQARVRSKLKTAVVLFSNELGIIGRTVYADELMKLHQDRESM